MNKLKINKGWVFALFLTSIMCTIFITVSIFIYSYLIELKTSRVNEIIPFQATMVVCGLASLMFLVLSIETFINEAKYYKKLVIPKSDFKIDIYDSFFVFTFENKSWVINGKYKKVLDLENIEITKYYNRKEIHLNTVPKIPFVHEVQRMSINAPVAQ